jgi:hypothetical protein
LSIASYGNRRNRPWGNDPHFSDALRQSRDFVDCTAQPRKLGTIMQIALFDTTLRDGTQSEGLSLSVEDKIKISRLLDGFGIHYIEGGYPGSNPKDVEFFRRAPELGLKHAKLTAFGSTRHAKKAAADDDNMQAWWPPARRRCPSSARPGFCT